MSKMQKQILILFVCVVAVFSSPISEIEAKLRSLIASEKTVSLKGRGVAVSARSTGSAVTASQRDLLLQLHNDARNNVQPPAENMPQMAWSNELATVAQKYADNCVWAHNSARTSQASSFYYVGENIYVTTVSSGYLENGVASWVNEKDDYDYASNSCNGVCGHYTQVVWADSTQLGCGVGSCATMTNLPSYFSNTKFLVCNYGPGGNYIGQKPYAEGTGSGDSQATGTNTSNGCK